jgi:hypothetical protein
MRRYARQIGSVTVGDAGGVEAWIVVKTDEVPHLEIMSKGFEEVPHNLSDNDVKERYGVAVIYTVNDDRMRTKVKLNGRERARSTVVRHHLATLTASRLLRRLSIETHKIREEMIAVTGTGGSTGDVDYMRSIVDGNHVIITRKS